jgi:DNA repair protein RadA/Sms
MAKTRTTYECRDCGTESVTWQGRCPGCGAWNTLDKVESVPRSGSVSDPGLVERSWSGGAACPIGEVDLHGWEAHPTGVPELDRVLGGGLVSGSVTLVGGEPGIGKSTLLLQVAAAVARRGRRVLYASGEEAAPQVRHRAERLRALPDELWLAAETSLPGLLHAVATVQPELLVVDSIQTLADPGREGVPGSLAQLRHVASVVVAEAKSRPVTVVLVGHVTKDGALAGPRALEHLVDTVLSFEGDGDHALRLLRAVKHRFGSTDELGVFEMASSGLAAVADPSSRFLADRMAGVPGSVVVPTLDGHRPLLVELQALTTRSVVPVPRRTARGLDSGRLGLLLAVLDRRLGVPVGGLDVYASAVGGARVTEPGADLALTLALVSAATDRPLAPGVVVCGEVGLAGEVRRITHVERRLAEAVRLGFDLAVVPPGTNPPDGMRTIAVPSVHEALTAVGLGSERSGWGDQVHRFPPSG